MRVLVCGWKRDHGTRVIMNADLEEGYERPTGSSFSPEKIYVRTRASGAVEVLTGPESLNLSGRYQAIVRLTKDDILLLFAEAYSDQFADVIRKLAKALPEPPSEPLEDDDFLRPLGGTRKRAARKRTARAR